MQLVKLLRSCKSAEPIIEGNSEIYKVIYADNGTCASGARTGAQTNGNSGLC